MNFPSDISSILKEARIVSHIHPSTKPEKHIFTEKKETIKSFTIKAIKILDEKGLL